MAKKRKRSSKCSIVTICGKRRRVCRDSKGRIKTNTSVTTKKGKWRGAPAKSKRRKSRKKKCEFGVNKITKKCLKRARKRK